MADIIGERRSRLFHLNDVLYLPVPADYVMQQGSSDEESPEFAATDPGTVARCVCNLASTMCIVLHGSIASYLVYQQSCILFPEM